MITKTDCVLLLTELQESGVDIGNKIESVLRSDEIDVDILKFINDKRPLDLLTFYEKIRKSYNEKKSKLYINIVKEVEDVNDVLITLSALQTQILLFSKTVDSKEMFLKHSRVAEITKVLYNYYSTYDLTPCLKLLKLLKADLKVLEQYVR